MTTSLRKINKIVVHHTCTGSVESTIRALKSRGCSTHFIIDKTGKVTQLLPVDQKAVHCIGHNEESIGIDLVHKAGEKWPEIQIESCIKLCSKLVNKYCIEHCIIPENEHVKDIRGICGHGSLRPTECPQGAVDSMIEFIRVKMAYVEEGSKIYF